MSGLLIDYLRRQFCNLQKPFYVNYYKLHTQHKKCNLLICVFSILKVIADLFFGSSLSSTFILIILPYVDNGYNIIHLEDKSVDLL